MNSRNMREDMFLLDKNGKCDEIVIFVEILLMLVGCGMWMIYTKVLLR